MLREFIKESLNRTAFYALITALYASGTAYNVMDDNPTLAWVMGIGTLIFVITTGSTAVTLARSETTGILRHTTKVLKAANRMLDDQEREMNELRTLLRKHAPHVTLPTGGEGNIRSDQGI